MRFTRRDKAGAGKASGRRRAAARSVLVALAAAFCLAAPPAAAQQLTRQSVSGAWRECVYTMRTTLGSSNPRQPIGVPTERAVRVGRGEPCPAVWPGEQRRRRDRPTGPSTWTSEPPPDPR